MSKRRAEEEEAPERGVRAAKPLQPHTTIKLAVATTLPSAAKEISGVIAAGGGTLSGATRMSLRRMICDLSAAAEVIAAIELGHGGMSTRARLALARGVADHTAAADIAQAIA